MSEAHESEPVTELSLYAQAFLDVLERHVDTPITQTDVRDECDELDWNGQFDSAWKELEQIPELADRLTILSVGKGAMYSLLSRENEVITLRKRMNYIRVHTMSKESPKNVRKMWNKRSLALGALCTAVCGGIAVGVHYKRKN